VDGGLVFAAGTEQPSAMNKEIQVDKAARIQKVGEEEKKESAESKGATESVAGRGDDDDDDRSSSSSRDEYELQPLQLLGPEGKKYQNDEDLQVALEKAGIGDARVILVNNKPYELMPSFEHDNFTADYVNDFAKSSLGKWGACVATSKVSLSNGTSRCPDLSYWGYPRCNEKCTRPLFMNSVPDVVIQFSWKNPFNYEEEALGDMMTKSLEKKGGPLSATCPRVGYLIKVRFSKKRKMGGAFPAKKTQDMEGLDVYRLIHGTTVADAKDPTKHGAELMHYTPKGEDVLIVIKPEDLGIMGWFEAWRCGSYVLKASEIFKAVDAEHKALQADGLA
jgi:hypothetical protein